MSAALTSDQVAKIIDLMKADVCRVADAFHTAGPDGNAGLHGAVELRFAMIAVLKAAIDTGVPAELAFGSLRDLGAASAGMRIGMLHPGETVFRPMIPEGQAMLDVYAEAACEAASANPDEAELLATPTHSFHPTRQ